MEQDMIIMQDIFRFKQLGIDQNGRAFGQFEATGVRPTFVDRLEADGHQAAVEPVPGARAAARLSRLIVAVVDSPSRLDRLTDDRATEH